MKPLFVYYPKCGTCRKALKWLQENGVEVEMRDIILQSPTDAELSRWMPMSGVENKRWVNTSGQSYRAPGMKEQVAAADTNALRALLAADGKLVKRPILVTDSTVLVGFKEEEWQQALLL